MTPMQTLKNSFDLFKSMLPPSLAQTALNKSDEDVYVSNYCGDREVHEKKGVRSDFIKFFKAKPKGDTQSLGFAFTYLGLPQDEHRVLVTLKTGNDDPVYLISGDLTIPEFQEKFSDAIKKIAALDDKNFLNIIEIFKGDFSMGPRKNVEKRRSQAKPSHLRPGKP